MTLHGTILGKYRIEERLGEGGMGTVYRARDELVDRDVAIKVLRPELARQGALVERFRAEANALARLTHPRIAALHGLERDGDQLYMIMEFCRGETLEALVQRMGRLPWRRAAELCACVCDALDHAHDEGVVHRDIKPANIMLATGNRVKVMDFGIARVAGRGRQTQLGHSVGTPMYMAPEQLRGDEVDGRVDLYALGAVLYELITGRLAFDADSDYKLMMMQMNDPPPAPSAMVADVPASIDAIVARAMAKRAEDRFASASAMRSALERAVRDAGPDVATTDAPRPSPATRLGVGSTPAPAPHTSAAPPGTMAATADHVAATRIDAGPGATRIDSGPGATRLGGDGRTAAWWMDWRVWGLAAAAVIVLALLLRPSGEHRTDIADQPATADTVPVPARRSSSPTPRVSGGDQPYQPPAPRIVPPSTTLRPISPETGAPVAGGSGRTAPPARDRTPVPAPTRDPVREQPTPPTPQPTPQPTPVEGNTSGGGSASARARSAVAGWIGALAARDASRISRAMDGGSKAQGDLLTLVRDGRVASAEADGVSVQIEGDRGSATGSANVVWKSAFGATRRVPVQFSFELRHEGGEWRVSGAHIVGSPKLR